MASKKTTAKKTVKKVAPAKKPAAKKAASATKPKAVAKKAVPIKKATPAKKVVASPKKKAPAKVVQKKAAPAKVTQKKAAPAKTVQKKAAVKPAVKKPVAAKKVSKKTAVKPTNKKSVPVKKAPAKPVAKKAPIKALAKKVVAKKPTATKTAAAKPAPAKKVIAKAKPATVKKAVKPAKAPKEKKVPVKPVAAAPSRRIKKQHVVHVQPSAKSEIIDAVRQLPKKHISKPGEVIAIRKIEKRELKEEHDLTMREYNPTQRSVLDAPDQNSGPVYRYNDEDLNEFKELILQRLENARKELAYLQGLITRKDEAGTEDTDNRFNHMEDGSGAMEREQLSQLAGRQIQFIGHLENALVRIENKTYGICRVTGHLIDKARLRAVPHATLSIEAKNGMKK
jgi:RNA polymerase-binding transcription factor DksA